MLADLRVPGHIWADCWLGMPHKLPSCRNIQLESRQYTSASGRHRTLAAYRTVGTIMVCHKIHPFLHTVQERMRGIIIRIIKINSEYNISNGLKCVFKIHDTTWKQFEEIQLKKFKVIVNE